MPSTSPGQTLSRRLAACARLIRGDLFTAPTLATPNALPALTTVRIFLALGVVLFHLQLTWAWPTAAYTGLLERARLGVDMFFILSGFVLAHVYTRQIETGSYSHRRFLIARLARIYPAHLAILLLMVVIAGFAMGLGERFDPALYSPGGLLRTALLVHAWTPTNTPVEWNGPSWSLSAEWAAYLLFPVFAAIGVGLKARPLLLIAIAVLTFAVLDGLYRFVFNDALLHAEFNLGVMRIAPTFLGGMALQACADRLSLRRVTAVAIALGAASLLVGLMHARADERLVVAAAGGLILALALVSKAGADGPLAWPGLIFLGEASYAIYLLHLPLLVLWKNARALLVGGDSAYTMPMIEVLGFLALTLAGGAILHIGLERPVRDWVRRRFLPATRVNAQ